MSECAVPQWKRELIARLKQQNRQHFSAVQKAEPFGCEQCECIMVQEPKSDSDEDLHYGPGIVSRLKERYLSLAQRDVKPRPTILRKAASLENLLEDVVEEKAQRRYQARDKGGSNRYVRKGVELKRARSVETISEEVKDKPKRESWHEEVRAVQEVENGEKENKYTRINRPKRIAPVVSEREKPPVDVVKQAKMIFEKRPEQRTKPPQHTGEVAAKVATYKSIIVQNKAAKKPALKVKPVISSNDKKTNGVNKSKRVSACSPEKKHRAKSPEIKLDLQLEKKFSEESSAKIMLSPPVPSPIPDISRVDFKVEENGSVSSLTETPDLIITSSPVPAVNSPSFRIAATENFIREEIRLAESERSVPKVGEEKPPLPTTPPPTFHLNKNVLNTQTPPFQPLTLEINGTSKRTKSNDSPPKKLSPSKPTLTTLEIEKNLINTAKTLEKPLPSPPVPPQSNSVKCTNDNVSVNKVPKVRKSNKSRELENNSIVFDFTGRKDVPDYVSNDGVKRMAKLEKPKAGEGGIILLPGAAVGESFTDEDEEILRSLEGPPSPCDVTFINDNILIDGKSSLSQKAKKPKGRISFVDEGPSIYEYPSESSLLIEDVAASSASLAQIRNSVPLTGTSSLANYTPKSTEDFKPGVSRSVSNAAKAETKETGGDLMLEEMEEPIMFSAGANSDILF